MRRLLTGIEFIEEIAQTSVEDPAQSHQGLACNSGRSLLVIQHARCSLLDPICQLIEAHTEILAELA